MPKRARKSRRTGLGTASPDFNFDHTRTAVADCLAAIAVSLAAVAAAAVAVLLAAVAAVVFSDGSGFSGELQTAFLLPFDQILPIELI